MTSSPEQPGHPDPGQQHYLERELRHALREDPKVFDFLEQGSLDGIWFWDLQNPEHEWMSSGFWTTLGHDPADHEHLAEEWQHLIHPEDLEVAKANLQTHCEDPTHPYDQVVRYRHRDGHWVWIRCRGLAIRDPDGRPIRMLGTHVDVTSIIQREHSLLAAAEQQRDDLLQANRELQQFTSFASHDLQAPLRTISSFLGLLQIKLGDQMDSEAKDWMQRIQNQAGRMRNLIDQLLVFSRVEKRDLEGTGISTNELVDRIAQEFRPQLEACSGQISRAELPKVRGDALMVDQVFRNLIENALHYRTEVAPQIRIDARPAGSFTELTVSDNGIGIASAHLETVVQPFKRLHSSDRIEGSGLGLAIVRRIVGRHGGTLRLESEPGEGTRVHFTLPVD